MLCARYENDHHSLNDHKLVEQDVSTIDSDLDNDNRRLISRLIMIALEVGNRVSRTQQS